MKRPLIAFALTAALFGASVAASAQGSNQPHLLYLPDNSSRVDHTAIIQAFESEGFIVDTYAYTNESRVDYAHNIADRIHGLIREGVDPAKISVMGAGWGSDVALLASAVTGNRQVNYVVLGSCNSELKDQPGMHLTGNVMALHDAGTTSQSCRPLFTGSPRLSARRDIKLSSSFGGALFDTAHSEWTKPATEWMRQGKVNVGEINVAVGEP